MNELRLFFISLAILALTSAAAFGIMVGLVFVADHYKEKRRLAKRTPIEVTINELRKL